MIIHIKVLRSCSLLLNSYFVQNILSGVGCQKEFLLNSSQGTSNFNSFSNFDLNTNIDQVSCEKVPNLTFFYYNRLRIWPVFFFSSKPTFLREWPSGLRRCDQNWMVPGSNSTGRSAGLRDPTSLRGSR